MIQIARSNIFGSPAQALVNPVNTVGVMGRGLAADFKQRYPHHHIAYQRACRAGQLVPGRVFSYEERGKIIVCLPTKRHWRERSRLSYIEDGLDALVAEIAERDIESIAIPALGCGLGQLSWHTVRPVIERSLAPIADSVEIYLHPPGVEKPKSRRRSQRTYNPQVPDMKRGRPAS